jgi:hypothetical protein
MHNVGRLALAGLASLAATTFSAGAAERNPSIYRPAQAVTLSFGSKIAAGYFLEKEGVCAVSVFVAENTGDSSGPSASRLQVKVAPGENVRLNSVEGQAVEFKCGAGAATLEVKGGAAPSHFVSR